MESQNEKNYAVDTQEFSLKENQLRVDDKTLDTCRLLLHIVFKDYKGPVAIRLWNNEIVIGDKNAVCTLVFQQSYPLRELCLSRDMTSLVDAHLCGDVDGEGDLEALFSLVDYLQNKKLMLAERIRFFQLAARMPNNKPKNIASASKTGAARDSNSKHSIAHHYDIHNNFYRLFLDPEMVYSCAYFSTPEQSLTDAQRDKLDYICRKLRLLPGQKLLDIGCGWGGLAFWAAQNYGVEVHGITLSQEQYDYGVARAHALKLNDKVSFELRDYRELPADTHYDRIVSVGMFEHIGIDNFPTYFRIIRGLLEPGGIFLNHGITNDSGWQRTPITRFINEYIFPDGELARVSEVTTAMEKAGFEILDTEALRPHYAMTLRRWVSALEENSEKAANIAGEATYRLWRLYMAGSAFYFNQGATGIYQIVASKNRQPWPLPLRRDGLYRD
tara:strand:+ start:161 stop:1489 length:1329 start_codon:yes stop_codon:yes gene_type:complete